MSQVSPIAQQVWDMKYRLRTESGNPVDKTVEDTWERVAKAVAAAESAESRDAWAARFRSVLEGYRFLPAGRILAGAGSGRRVTLFNCFVMGAIPDSMEGIFDALKEAALTMRQGGGIGYDFSTLRPKGAPVRGVAADASGPVSFMDLWDGMCRTILSAGTRRGAMMACLRCDHPDIEAFIDAKREPGRLRMFNLSVLVTDAFMAAVEEDAAWDLVFDGTVHRTLPARALWDRILQATYAYAEPGVIFIDRINRANNLWYVEDIRATNPCVTGDTWIMTDGGPRRAADLVGRPAAMVVDGLPYASGPQGFFSTGRKPVLRLTTREGHALRLTTDHPVRRVVREGNRRRLEWAAAGDLAAGDPIRLHDHRQASDWAGRGTEAEGYLLGLLIGDGVLKRDAAVLSVWSEAARREEVAPVMAAAQAAVLSLDHRHRADFAGWHAITGRGEWRLKSAGVRLLAESYGLTPAGGKTVTPACEETSSAFHIGLLRGLFDTDGSVQGTQLKGVSVRLAQSSLPVLEAAQRMLLRLGIVSTLYKGRRPEQPRAMPDGKGGQREYLCKAQHGLVMSRDNLRVFADRIGFSDAAKAARLRDAMAAYRRGLNRETFTARVEAVVPDGEAEVFDVQVPGINAFDANGLVVHNCGEQPLPPYGTCLLGSVNLAALVVRPFEADAALDEAALDDVVAVAVRMLDDVIDVSGFPLPAQREEALAKRRIGLGVTGLADALIMLGVRYGSDHAVALVERWLARLRRAAYLASVELAREKGPFPLFDADKYLAGEGLAGLDEDVRQAIAAHGVRNALLTSIAPTGTISLLADNVSSGIEPVFAFTATRRVVQRDGTTREELVADHAWRLHRRLKGEDAPLTDAFVDVSALTPRDHLVMQAAAQRYVDSSISKTINVPEAITFEAFGDVYRQAWDMGCKGCTTYRPNPVTGAVLSAPSAVPSAAPGHDDDAPLARPRELPGITYKVRWPESDHALYITLNDIEVDDPARGRHRRPFEVFINSKNMEHYAWTVALTRMISAVFRRGGEVAFVVEELKAVFDPRGGQWMEGRYVPSLLAAIGDVIERHMIAIGFLDAPVETNGSAFRACPKCGQRTLARQENCDTCAACGYSRCG